MYTNSAFGVSFLPAVLVPVTYKFCTTSESVAIGQTSSGIQFLSNTPVLAMAEETEVNF